MNIIQKNNNSVKPQILTKNTIQDMTKSYTFEELMGLPKDALTKTSGTMACYLITKA